MTVLERGKHFLALCIYQILLVLLLPLAWFRGAKQDAARNKERFGLYPSVAKQWLVRGSEPLIWIHAASVGESLVAISLIRELIAQSPTPIKFVVTTVTATAAEQIKQKTNTNEVLHLYAPYDVLPVVSGFLRRVRPSLCLLIETELWPQTVRQLSKHNIPQLLINGRLSEKSAQRYAKFKLLSEPMLQQIDGFLMQNSEDAERLKAFNIKQHAIKIAGSIKFDLTIPADVRERAQEYRERWHAEHSLVWLVASTHSGEETIILDIFAELSKNITNVLLVIVPRHPQRFDEVAQLLEQKQLHYVRQSSAPDNLNGCDILLGDCMGELLAFYGACDMATVGGSLVDIGGHNLIEPAAWKIPVTTGPYLRNFADIASQLSVAGGLVVADNAQVLAQNLQQLCENSELRENMGRAGEKVALENRGALQKTVQVILQSL